MNSNSDVLSAVQTRSGLLWLKYSWLNLLEEQTWADSTLVWDKIWNEHALIFPLFALRYNWNGEGNNIY